MNSLLLKVSVTPVPRRLHESHSNEKSRKKKGKDEKKHTRQRRTSGSSGPYPTPLVTANGKRIARSNASSMLHDRSKQCYTYAVNRDGKRCSVHSSRNHQERREPPLLVLSSGRITQRRASKSGKRKVADGFQSFAEARLTRLVSPAGEEEPNVLAKLLVRPEVPVFAINRSAFVHPAPSSFLLSCRARACT